jgi:hypothetical protein
MSVGKSVVAKIAKLSQFDEFKTSESLPLIICVAMSHIVSSFEGACGDFHVNEPPQNEVSNLSHMELRLPYLRVGDFQIDPEQYASIRIQIVAKELRRTMQELEGFGIGVGILPKDRGARSKMHNLWYNDLEDRLKALLASVENSGGRH